MLLRYQDAQFIGKFCKTERKEDGYIFKFIGFETATEEDKLRLIDYDNWSVACKDEHLISNIDEVKVSIGYKDP